MKYLDLFVTIGALAFLAGGSAKAESARIYGNANGLWSPTHPHLTQGRTKPNSPVLYTPPAPVVEPEPEVAETPDVCPTIQSAPHLCQPSV
jgi:hypothetical protein